MSKNNGLTERLQTENEELTTKSIIAIQRMSDAELIEELERLYGKVMSIGENNEMAETIDVLVYRWVSQHKKYYDDIMSVVKRKKYRIKQAYDGLRRFLKRLRITVERRESIILLYCNL